MKGFLSAIPAKINHTPRCRSANNPAKVKAYRLTAVQLSVHLAFRMLKILASKVWDCNKPTRDENVSHQQRHLTGALRH